MLNYATIALMYWIILNHNDISNDCVLKFYMQQFRDQNPI